VVFFFSFSERKKENNPTVGGCNEDAQGTEAGIKIKN
jgi:hypothetical protein